MYTDYMMNDENVKDYQKYERTIKTIQKRFKTYGYERIKTSMFEQYDLYSKVTSAVNQKEMIKVINRTGEVLVLRPDVTIPITKQVADHIIESTNDLRYFYIEDVFRQSLFDEESIERTQAGIECFSESSPEIDAEVLALACHTLRDLGFNEVKIEIGHANFFKELVQDIKLTARDQDQLKKLIQAKNIIDIEPFLNSFSIEKELIDAVLKIPFLYGKPIEVSEMARDIVRTPKMNETLDYLIEVFEILKLYGLEDHIVMDLGLINHMGYYSDVIFQGFVEKFGKPVLMGGRYDQLGNEFGSHLPAIGFACEVESLLKAMGDNKSSSKSSFDIKISYDEESLKESIMFANELRERNYTVLSFPKKDTSRNSQESNYQIVLNKTGKTFSHKEETIHFATMNELFKLMNGVRGAL